MWTAYDHLSVSWQCNYNTNIHFSFDCLLYQRPYILSHSTLLNTRVTPLEYYKTFLTAQQGNTRDGKLTACSCDKTWNRLFANNIQHLVLVNSCLVVNLSFSESSLLIDVTTTIIRRQRHYYQHGRANTKRTTITLYSYDRTRRSVCLLSCFYFNGTSKYRGSTTDGTSKQRTLFKYLFNATDSRLTRLLF
jgi:hypothetical protein